jgi:hypothetical protein
MHLQLEVDRTQKRLIASSNLPLGTNKNPHIRGFLLYFWRKKLFTVYFRPIYEEETSFNSKFKPYAWYYQKMVNCHFFVGNRASYSVLLNIDSLVPLIISDLSGDCQRSRLGENAVCQKAPLGKPWLCSI